MSELLPCPFCGRAPSADLSDTLYPSGTMWVEIEPGLRSYHHRIVAPAGAQQCWTMHCPTSAGGCGAQITADSEAETIAAWNRRAFPTTHGATSENAGASTPTAQIEPESFASQSVAVAVAGRAPVAQSGECETVIATTGKRHVWPDGTVSPIADEARDAARRYEWLRNCGAAFCGENIYRRNKWLDAAIDRAIAAERGETRER